MTPEEKLDLIADWHDQWGDQDLSDLEPGTIWHELFDLLYPKAEQAPVLVLVTPEAPKAPLPGRWYE